MTVGELRKALEGIPDEMHVLLSDWPPGHQEWVDGAWVLQDVSITQLGNSFSPSGTTAVILT